MKKINLLTVFIVCILSALMLSACGKSEFAGTADTDKQMTITAERAARDAALMTGTLTADDGETITITSHLTKGSVRVEIIPIPEGQSAENMPDLESEAILTADLGPNEETSRTVPAGSYMVKAVCLKKATGTIGIQVS